ncbi:MAG: efflux RND transporter periplasmic adaptor subunit [Vicinamibacterales bacterium]
MRKAFLTLVVLAALGGGSYAYYRYRQTPVPPVVTTAAITRGDIAERVGATGTLQAVTTVQVGTQVSGTIQSLHADFNSLVRKGQVIARLDPSLFQTQIEQARANLIRAQAEVERLRVGLDDARTKLTRARELSARQLLPRSDLDTAEVSVRSAEAQLRSAEAQVTQAQASLNQNQVNLDHTVITAPIDGLVISRNVDVGQTVAASMQAPTLFVLAADLTKMQVLANLDESDVGRIRPGQAVSFRVDAFPSEEFTGTVGQVRLQPIVQQNVVTYATVIDVPNPDLKLKPGMTANVNVEIARRRSVLRVPNTALRFRPTAEIFAALGQTAPAGRDRDNDGALNGEGFRRTGGPPAAPVGTAAPTAASQAPSGPSGSESHPTVPRGDAPAAAAIGHARSARVADAAERPGQSQVNSDVGRRGRLLERLQSLTPEERERASARMRARGFDPTAGSAEIDATAPDGSRKARQAAPPQSKSLSARNPEATTIDALFGPLPSVETSGRVWRQKDGTLVPVRVRLGITDGQVTELLEGDLQEGTELVTNVAIGGTSTRPAANTLPPFMGPQPGRFGGPGGFGGNRSGGTGR